MLKLTLLARLQDAEGIEQRLVEWLDPEPSAVSRFDAAPGLQTVEAYFEQAPSAAEIGRMVEAQPLAAPHVVEHLADENWVRRVEETLSPVRAGRFVIHGPHDRAVVGDEPFAIEIEAGEAFGTAHHPTTRGCLIAIDRLLGAAGARMPARSLDLGCGSGVLAIAAARLTKAPLVLASDIDRRSVEIAAENFVKNRVDGLAVAIHADGFQHPQLSDPGQFDLVIANILAEPLVALAPAVRRSLSRDATVILSGLLDDQAEQVASAYQATGLRPVDHLKLDGWSTLVFATPVAAEEPAQ